MTELAFCPAIFDGDILALDVAGLGQTLAERCYLVHITVRRSTVEKANHRRRRLLGASRDRHHCRALHRCDEPSPPHRSPPPRWKNAGSISAPGSQAVQKMMRRNSRKGRRSPPLFRKESIWVDCG